MPRGSHGSAVSALPGNSLPAFHPVVFPPYKQLFHVSVRHRLLCKVLRGVVEDCITYKTNDLDLQQRAFYTAIRQNKYRLAQGSLPSNREPCRYSVGYRTMNSIFKSTLTPESDGTAQPVQSQGGSRCPDQTTNVATTTTLNLIC